MIFFFFFGLVTIELTVLFVSVVGSVCSGSSDRERCEEEALAEAKTSWKIKRKKKVGIFIGS